MQIRKNPVVDFKSRHDLQKSRYESCKSNFDLYKSYLAFENIYQEKMDICNDNMM